MINIPKGTKDLLPADSYEWQQVEKTAKELAETFAFQEIRTPTFEHTELFLRGVGDTTDVVNKEMYTFLDKGERSITLKPEGTAGVARAFIENGLQNEGLPLKAYYITPAFRYERPQAGRLREFHQFGVEFFGSPNASADAEVILLADALLKKFSIRAKLKINSIGCPECRKAYNDKLKDFFRPHLDKLCHDCASRFEKNPLRLLDCKEENCKKINETAPSILDSLCDDCKAHFADLQSLLTQAGVSYEIDPKIVRGLDYYTRTVFEFVSEDIGAQGTVCGGGRYDRLIEQLGGGNVPAVGFGVGIERLLLCAKSAGHAFEKRPTPKAYLLGMDDETRNYAFALCSALRKDGVKAECDHMARSVKAQFKYADKIGAEEVAVIGGSEMETKRVSLKNMHTGEVREITIESPEAFVKEFLKK